MNSSVGLLNGLFLVSTHQSMCIIFVLSGEKDFQRNLLLELVSFCLLLPRVAANFPTNLIFSGNLIRFYNVPLEVNTVSCLVFTNKQTIHWENEQSYLILFLIITTGCYAYTTST